MWLFSLNILTENVAFVSVISLKIIGQSQVTGKHIVHVRFIRNFFLIFRLTRMTLNVH